MSTNEIDALLAKLSRSMWALWVFGPKHGPDIVAAVRRWPTCADVVILRGETGGNDATAFRTPAMLGTDPFMPELVSWQYHSSAVWTLRAVLALPAPGHPEAPIAVLRPDPLCFLPSSPERPIAYRPGQLVSIMPRSAQPTSG